MYFRSNSPVLWRFIKVVLPVPPSPTRITFQVGVASILAGFFEESAFFYDIPKFLYLLVFDIQNCHLCLITLNSAFELIAFHLLSLKNNLLGYPCGHDYVANPLYRDRSRSCDFGLEW